MSLLCIHRVNIIYYNLLQHSVELQLLNYTWAPSSEFVSSSIPSWQILTAHAQPFRGARDLAFCLKVPLDSLLVWASSEGSGETARMRRLAWTFAARIGDKYQIRLTRSTCIMLYYKFSELQHAKESSVITCVLQQQQKICNNINKYWNCFISI